ncbi:GP46-like surface antigen, putative [Bodo saltans]|uniref:GP46-like surface antigen, putative n=1 Tax=Bodo saltans TaxID=75058 RepID=A0A0S4ITN5_BODSA|nr:GP46-like surface antigen, putative [Bodo saltans]|eukprot:CUF20659.1 GP46-like surface antigen, putative [Bodo saltans]
MSFLRLRNNSFQGTLPAEYSKLPISQFDASSNHLSGTLPLQYAAWKNAQSVSLSSNMLTGTIPASWSEGMPSLQSLLLYNNSLSGTIPSAPPFPSLNDFSISSNDFSGPLPSPSTWPLLFLLDAQNNTQLTGPIALQQLVSFVSVCGTELCSAAAFTGTFVCVPGGVLANAIANGVLALDIFVQLRAFAESPPSCSTTSVAPSSISPNQSPPLPNSSNIGSNYVPAIVQSTLASAVYATALGGAGTLGRGAVPALQRGAMSLRLAARCNAATSIADSAADGGSTMFSDLADNPLDVSIPVGAVDLSAAGGAAVMNAVLVVVIGATLHASALLQRYARVRSHQRAMAEKNELPASSIASAVMSLLPASRLPGSLAVPYGTLANIYRQAVR